MALRRLTVKRNDGDAPCARTGVPAPVRSHGRACSPAQVLEICLDHVGLRLGYDAIMGPSDWPCAHPSPGRRCPCG